ncbi:MAG TPA: ATP-dependent metalloprotease, partial [Gammaproteobacteria bacterium]|nr:ATP-dependent metalloprotease [Gammaproteobacteria bacterium]
EEILKSNIDKLHLMAKALIKYETIDANQIDAIMKGEEPGPPADWVEPDDDGDSPLSPGKSETKPASVSEGGHLGGAASEA